MNYGIKTNPYKRNALNRGNSNAPIGKLMSPQKFQTGGSVRALEEIMPYSPVVESINRGWEMMGASMDKTAARKRTQEAAEKRAKEIQKKNKKSWIQKLVETAITVANPFVGALVKGAGTYQRSKWAHDEAKEASKDYKGSWIEKYFAEVEEHLYENKNNAAVYDILGSLAVSEISGQFDSAGTENVVSAGTENVVDEGTKTFAGETFDLVKDLTVGGAGGINPQYNAVANLIGRIPGLENIMQEEGGQVFTNTILQELSRPDDPKVDLSPYNQFVNSGPSQYQLARNIQI